MKVRVKVNDSDYLKFCEFQLTHSRQGKRALLLQRITLPLISVAMVAAFIVLHFSTRAIVIEIITLTVACIIWVIGAPEMLKRNIRRDFYKNKNKGKVPFRGTSVLDFSDEGITEISGSYSESVPYSGINVIVKSGERLYVYTDGDKGFVVPLDDAAKNGRKAAKLLSQKTGLEPEIEE